MTAVCIFCGARTGIDSRHAAAAARVGAEIAKLGITLVYGGGRVGLMGEISRAARSAGGAVVGVIPEVLVAREVADVELTRLEVVADMAVRKTRMIDLSDAFLALPGGLGTLDELFEVLTLAQIGVHAKPIAIWNADGLFDDLLALGERLIAAGFVGAEHWRVLEVLATEDDVVSWLRRRTRAGATLRTQ
jgi:hypothetical protein